MKNQVKTQRKDTRIDRLLKRHRQINKRRERLECQRYREQRARLEKQKVVIEKKIARLDERHDGRFLREFDKERASLHKALEEYVAAFDELKDVRRKRTELAASAPGIDG